MKGTKLWQAPGSPIIQGRSRRQPSFLLMWGAAWFISSMAAIMVAYLLPTSTAPTYVEWLFAILGALAGSFLGVLISRAMGWRFQWVWGIFLGLGGSAIAVASTWYLLSIVSSVAGVGA